MDFQRAMLAVHLLICFQDQMLPIHKNALDCMILCFWMESGKKTATNLSSVVNWTLTSEGIVRLN